MAYYSERKGLRKSLIKTYHISIDAYALLFKCCEKYYDHLAWKYPEYCQDGYGCCGINFAELNLDLKYEIPSLFRDQYDNISVPKRYHNIFDGESIDDYDQYALLDLVEFFAFNIRDVEIKDYHSYFQHYHLNLQETQNVVNQFKNEINNIFAKTGLLYNLNDNYEIERIIENSILTTELEKTVLSVKETGIKELLQKAIDLHLSPSFEDNKNAVEKLWDAYERLKTYYISLSKKDSANKIVNDMSSTQEYFDLFNTEFSVLTKIGNDYRIRHHETNKIEITDPSYYDYFFNRCLSLIALAIQYLK